MSKEKQLTDLLEEVETIYAKEAGATDRVKITIL